MRAVGHDPLIWRLSIIARESVEETIALGFWFSLNANYEERGEPLVLNEY